MLSRGAWVVSLAVVAGAVNATAQVNGADSVRVRAVAARSVVRPGDLVPIAVVLEHARGFHSWPHVPVVPPEYSSVVPIPTSIDMVALPNGAAVGEIQWPSPVAVRVRYTRVPVDLLSYAGTAAAYVPVTLAPGQPPGDATVALRIQYQSCDERVCYPPQQVERTVSFWVANAGDPVLAGVNEPELFEGFRVAGGAGPGFVIPAYINVFGWSFAFEPTGLVGLSLLLVLAVVGGALLNFTPCVLPLVPIKILGLRAAAGAGAPSRVLALGIAMGLGIVAFWLALGGTIAFVAGFDAISSLFQTRWFAPAVGVVVAVSALGMLDLYQVRLPQAVYLLDPDRESVSGSFGFGALTAVLSTPCTAPFMAGASAWAVVQKPPLTLVTFGAIGVGMALPYVLLTARPAWLARLPRAGPGSVLLKQAIGLLMLAVAAFFLGSALSVALNRPPDPPSRAFWWVVGGFVLLACGWFAYRMATLAQSRAGQFAAAGMALMVSALTVAAVPTLASDGPIDWVEYTPERFADASARGDVVVLDFTAEWCLNCKVLESGVLYQERIAGLLSEPGVVPMRVDLTTGNPPGQAKLKQLGWVGIPLLAVFGPGTGYAAPMMYDSYTPGMVEDAVARARGVSRPAPSPATPRPASRTLPRATRSIPS